MRNILKRRDLLKTGAGLAALSLLPVMPVRAQSKVVMRISHPLPAAHHTGKQIQQFADAVKAASNGEIDVQVFPSEQAGKANENHPSVARGGIEAAASLNFQWGNTIPETSVTSIPYFIADVEKLRKFAGSPITALLDAKLEKRGVKNLAWMLTSYQLAMTANKPIVKIEDFKGLKVRGLNKMADQGLIAAGAAPSAMAAPEVYQALQAGVLDAAQTDVGAAVSRRFYEVQKNATVASLLSAFYHLYVNPAWWNGLSAAHKEIIQTAARKMELESIDITKATTEAAVGQLREKGMVVHLQTPEEAASWKATFQQPVIAEFLKTTPEDGQKLIDLIAKL